jgi:glutamyl/glutaminyl-tRNA synthetase
MKLETILYSQYENDLPQSGQHILGQLRGENIIVYQAFNPVIANYAVQHQKFGGSAYSFSRMSWIKPNFLWMMYRAGWAMKEHQQRILAIEISLTHFETILEQAVYSSFQPDVYTDKSAWEMALQTSEVRLQWDPDHNPSGAKLQRRAVQLGMKGYILKQFCTEWIVSIEDITPFVLEQGRFVAQTDWANLWVMKEKLIPIQNQATIKKFKIDNV